MEEIEDQQEETENEKTVNEEASLSNKDIISKAVVYGANYFTELAGRLSESTQIVGNAFGAIGYFTLDLIVKEQDQLRKHKLNRLARVGGSLFYLGAGAWNLISALNGGDYQSDIAKFFFDNGGNYQTDIANFAYDLLMAYQLDRDSKKLYKELNSGVTETTKDNAINDLKGLFGFRREKGKSSESGISGVSDLEKWVKKGKELLKKIKIDQKV